MSTKAQTTRRSFLKSGAIIAAPVVSAAVPAAALADDGSKSRLARLEDERAVVDLNRAFLRKFNASGAEGTAELFADGKAPALGERLAHLSLDAAEELEALEFSEDGVSASCRLSCIARTEYPLEGSETLVQMARLQGNGAGHASEYRNLAIDYVRVADGWAIGKLRLV